MNRMLSIVAALAVFLFGACAANAHHSVAAEFGNAEMFEIEGVVEKLFWTDPHIRVRIRITGGPLEEGEIWDAVSHAPGLLARTYGLYPGEIEVGDTLLIYGRPCQFNVNRFSMRNVSINGGPVRQLLRSRTQRASEVAAPLVLHQSYNAVSVAAGPPLARRDPQAMVGPWSRVATPPGAGLRPPAGRVHKRPSALLSSLDVCPIRRRADAAHLSACERADTAL